MTLVLPRQLAAVLVHVHLRLLPAVGALQQFRIVGAVPQRAVEEALHCGALRGVVAVGLYEPFQIRLDQVENWF